MNESGLKYFLNYGTEGDYSAFCVLIFALLPLLYSSAIFDPTQNPHIIGGMFIAMAFCFSLLFRRLDGNYGLKIIDVLWIIYIGFALQGVFHSRDVSIALFELGKIFFTYFLFILFQTNQGQGTALLSSSVAVSLVCVFQMIVVLCQKYIGWNIYGSESRFFGTMTHANVLSECMAFAFPLTLFGAIIGKKLPRILCCAGLISCFLLIVTLKTRAIWVGIIIAVVVVFFLLIKNNSVKPLLKWTAKYRKVLLSTASIMALLSGAFVFLDIKDFGNHLRTLAHLDTSGRADIWTKTINIIHEHFWFGVGLGNFRFYIPKTIGAFIQRPHNDYLWIPSETGIFGLLAFLAICFVALKKIFSNIKLLQGERLLINYCILFGFITYLIDSFFAFPKERPYNLVFLAFFIATPFSLSSPKSIVAIKIRVLALFLIGISAVFLVVNCFRYDGERLLKSAISNSALSPQQRLCTLQAINPWAYTADPFSIPIKYYEGMALLGVGAVAEAKQCFFRAYDVFPYQPDLLLNLGTACEITGEREKAKRFYRESIAAEGNDVRPKLNLAVLEYKDGELEKSVEIIRQIDTKVVKGDSQSLVQYNILKNSLRKYFK